ncbi:MAG: endonuclease [Acholeplasmataceae bacterium]
MYKKVSEISFDITPPLITLKDDINLVFSFDDIFSREKALTWIDVIDDVDELEDLDIQINYDSLILTPSGNFNESGSYIITYTAMDQSGNVGYLEITIRVYETLGSILTDIDYSNGYYQTLDNINDDITLIEELAYLLRDTIEYQKYEEARFIYASYDEDYQVVFYDYEGRDNSYGLIPHEWGNGGYVTLDNGTVVKLEREHVWACSDMMIMALGNDSSKYEGYAINDGSTNYRPGNSSRGHYSDLHNLWLSIGSANGTHSNYFYGEENGPIDEYYLVNSTFYPGQEYIGDIARILFYMTLMYPHLTLVETNDENAVTGSIYYGYLDILLYWNEIDPPSDYEIARNELIFNNQGNRNPFIDFYENDFAERIFYYGDPEVADLIY